jgi:hypothetical protein
MGIFDNLDQTEVFEQSQYFQTGRYIVAIKACKFIQGHRGESFVIEAIVKGAKSEHEKAPAYGQLAAQVWSASGDKRDIARNTWVGFLCAVYGKKPGDFNAEEWKATSEAVMNGALLGQLMYLEVFEITTKAGKPFTKHAWRNVPSASDLAEFGIDGEGNPVQ